MNAHTLAMSFVGAGMLILASAPANAWHVDGQILCDANQSGSIDTGDQPFGNYGYDFIDIFFTNSSNQVTTGYAYPDGGYSIGLPDVEDTYTQTLDMTDLPADATIVQPPGGSYSIHLTDTAQSATRNWLVDSAVCQTPEVADKCWLTGGGVKFSQITDSYVAEHGPRDNMGGNVYPSCDPNPGDGGQWNHVAQSAKLHFLGKSIQVVRCGNVPGIQSGSESPVTPYNFIEFKGTGTLKGIKGNKVDHGTVYFFARAEDRNEPGSNGAKDGADIDRYYIHVYSDPNDPDGTTLMLLDDDGNPATVDPVTITGGNMQIHISSCDNPPAQ